MGSEDVDGLPDELESWVAERAAAEDTTRSDVVGRLIAAYRLLDEHPEWLDDVPDDSKMEAAAEALGPAATEDDVETLESDLDALEAELDEIAERVSALESDLDEKITDVRERVIQVKRETDAKAPVDHGHPELEDRIAAGFRNYEEILEYLTETTDDLAEATDGLVDATDEHNAKLDTVAGAVVDLRSRVAALERDSAQRAAVADVRREANRHGVATATCDACGESVRLGLLDEPFCPHCETPVDGVEPKRGFFGSNRLTVGDLPALEPPDGSDASTEGDSATPAADELGGAFAESDEEVDDADGEIDGGGVDDVNGDAVDSADGNEEIDGESADPDGDTDDAESGRTNALNFGFSFDSGEVEE